MKPKRDLFGVVPNQQMYEWTAHTEILKDPQPYLYLWMDIWAEIEHNKAGMRGAEF